VTPTAPASLTPPSDDELARPPLLGYLVCVAAFLDVVVNRWILRSLDPERSRDLQFDLQRWGALPRNLAAVAGVVALAAALIAFVRLPGYAPIRRRLSLAAFAGIFLPTVTLATMLPREYTSTQLVIFGIGAGNILAILGALTALRRPGPVGLRIALGVAALHCFLAVLALLLGIVEQFSDIVSLVVLLLRRLGEALWLTIPFAAAATVLPRADRLRSRDGIALGISGVSAMITAIALTIAALALREDFGVVLYGAFRLDWALDLWPLLYVVPIAVYVGVAVLALLGRDDATRQIGAGLLLLCCAGHAPRAPVRLLFLVLGVMLLGRAAISMRSSGAISVPPPAPVPAPAPSEPSHSPEP
jgi:hypothetical protein